MIYVNIRTYRLGAEILPHCKCTTLPAGVQQSAAWEDVAQMRATRLKRTMFNQSSANTKRSCKSSGSSQSPEEVPAYDAPALAKHSTSDEQERMRSGRSGQKNVVFSSGCLRSLLSERRISGKYRYRPKKIAVIATTANSASKHCLTEGAFSSANSLMFMPKMPVTSVRGR